MQNVFARPVWPWVSVIALELAQAITLVPWLVVAGLSVMAFDAPGSTKMWQPWVFVGAVWSYPLWLLAAGIASWVLLAFGKRLSAVIVAAVFTLPIPLVLILAALG